MGSELNLVILVAGKGTRLRSRRAEVLHELNGWPLLCYPLKAAMSLPVARRIMVIVISHRAAKVRTSPSRLELVFVEQEEQLGTGHAVLQTEPFLRDAGGGIMILPGDRPLLRSEPLQRFLDLHRWWDGRLSPLTMELKGPKGYGRIVRDGQGDVEWIVEERDAGARERGLQGVNSGIYLVRNDGLLWEGLCKLRDDNAQGDHSLTDLIAIYRDQGEPVRAMVAEEPETLLGVNSPLELAQAGVLLRRRKLGEALARGVRLLLPEATAIEEEVQLNPDVPIAPSSLLKGQIEVERGCRVWPGTILEGAELGQGAVVEESLAEGFRVGPKTRATSSVICAGKAEKEGW